MMRQHLGVRGAVTVVRANKLYAKGGEMKLWVTPRGDRWLCDECQPEFEEQIGQEKWRIAFEKFEPMLRCSNCQHGDVEVWD